jgi:hypothetical protein
MPDTAGEVVHRFISGDVTYIIVQIDNKYIVTSEINIDNDYLPPVENFRVKA